MTLQPSWAVVGTMDEPAPLVLAWIAHHLWLGATEVHVYLDTPNPRVVELTQGFSNVHVTLCDDAFWSTSYRRARPIRHTARQKHNATTVYQTTQVDWVMHCDADEFLMFSPQDFEVLATTDARILRVENVERVRLAPSPMIFNGSFRGQSTDRVRCDRIYGRWAGFLEGGMAGYKDGKDIARTGHDLTMGVHYPIDAKTEKRHADPLIPLGQARILHFDGMTPLHNVIKLLKRSSEPTYQVPRRFGVQRERQFRYARNHAAKPVQMRKMLDGVFAITSTQAQMLGDEIIDLRFDPTAALESVGLSLDLTEAAFDAELREREASLIAKTGLRF